MVVKLTRQTSFKEILGSNVRWSLNICRFRKQENKTIVLLSERAKVIVTTKWLKQNKVYESFFFFL